MTIAQTLKALRKAYGITQDQLAEASGISGGTLRKYETGNRIPKISTLQKIADALNVDVNVFISSEIDSTKAMISLFNIFRAYSGKLLTKEEIEKEADDSIYLSFESLQVFMYSWYSQYLNMQNKIHKYSSIDNKEDRNKNIEQAQSDFERWMLTYPESEPNRELLDIMTALDKKLDHGNA